MHILIVDDDIVDRMSTVRALGQAGYQGRIIQADSAEEGLEYAQNESFDIILLDYQLPTMNGLELLKRLRETTDNNAAIAMLSHCEDEKLALKCIEAGAQDFLTKREVTAARLTRAMMQAKERFRYEKQLLDSHEKMRQLAEVDVLTGLANRYFFEKTLTDAIPVAKQSGRKLALLMLDLDKFKNVNDTLGHDAGDKLLKKIAVRLREPLREGDVLCRLGGDEFAILVHNIEHASVVHKIVERIFRSLKKPIKVKGESLVISASIGIATYPDCASDSIQLMKCADVAMYRSKEAGRNQSHLYSKALHEKIHKLFQLERDLYRAVENKEFVLYYQPQIDCQSHALVGAEALIRWDCPNRGLVSPLHFIPVAEEIGLINAIGTWVIEEACSKLNRWRKNYRAVSRDLFMAINLSAIQLSQPFLLKQIEIVLEKYKIPPKAIEFELTESSVNDSAEASLMLRKISHLGCRLALDDFGTGYSSLFQLQKNPFTILKIDKSFIQSVAEANNAGRFLHAINAFANILGMEVVAEGIETEAQYTMCRNLKFNRVQGYYFGKPVSAKSFEKEWLAPQFNGDMVSTL